MVGIRREIDEAARTQFAGLLLIELIAGTEVKFTGDDRYTLCMRMLMGWKICTRLAISDGR